ncbi:MAG TPA: phospho-N-acetylmuramoyl-pentapeptide-transferase [Actinomycetota bacterium]|nr:phospho-N-acetylmuramoyl-pentapeptide-transferase [Actinomycetota bacterium]
MKSILASAMVSLLVGLIFTPFVIRAFRVRGFGQLLREDWGEHGHHEEKRGTPTMGGVVLIAAVAAGYGTAHIVDRGLGWAGALVLATMAGMGFVGFLDDYTKIRKQRSLGLNKTAKILGQAFVAVAFGVAVWLRDDAPTTLSFVRETALDLGPFFVLWVFLMMAATTNGVNLTDGLDGLAAGSSALVFAAYMFIAFWQARHLCGTTSDLAGCYNSIPDPLDLAVFAAAGLGACAGFLWWNAAPAKIFMGDTGSLALGGGLAGLAILTSTQLLLVVLGGLFVLETTSVILQVISFRGFGRRAFRMAPLHHHFELGGWPEFTVIVRFWIIAGLAAALGLGLFYAEFLSKGGAQ